MHDTNKVLLLINFFYIVADDGQVLKKNWEAGTHATRGKRFQNDKYYKDPPTLIAMDQHSYYIGFEKSGRIMVVNRKTLESEMQFYFNILNWSIGFSSHKEYMFDCCWLFLGFTLRIDVGFS